MHKKGILYAIVTFIFIASICLAGYFAIQYNVQRLQSSQDKTLREKSFDELQDDYDRLGEEWARCKEERDSLKLIASQQQPKVTFESYEVIGIPNGAVKSHYQAAQLVRQKGILDQRAPSGETIDQWTLTVGLVNNVWQVGVRSHFVIPAFSCTYAFTSEDDFQAVDPCGWGVN
jgi:hypothetical protein